MLSIILFILFAAVIILILISMGTLLVGSSATEYKKVAYDEAKRNLNNTRRPLTEREKGELLEWSRRNL